MRGDLGSLDVMRPRTLAEALAWLGEPERPTPLAGGTDLFVLLNDGKQPSRRFLDLTLLPGLRGIESEPDGLRIGARTTYSDLRRSPLVRRRAPILAEMAATVGAVAIQNRGTLGGGLGNASPASDPAPVLLVLDASVELARREGRRVERRTVALASFFVDYRKTAARADELVTAILIPASALAGWRYAYRKVGMRRAQAISKVVAAAGVSRASRMRPGTEARIAFGSVAATTIRAAATEGALVGRKLDAGVAAEARTALLARDLRPIDDLRSTADYRALVAGRILIAMLAQLGDFSSAPLLAD